MISYCIPEITTYKEKWETMENIDQQSYAKYTYSVELAKNHRNTIRLHIVPRKYCYNDRTIDTRESEQCKENVISVMLVIK